MPCCEWTENLFGSSEGSLHSSHFFFYMKELHSDTHDTAQCIEHSLENYATSPEHNIPSRSEWSECQHQEA
jgi:hypothetical protein